MNLPEDVKFFLNAIEDEDVDIVQDMLDSKKITFSETHLGLFLASIFYSCITKNTELIKIFIPAIKELSQLSSATRTRIYEDILYASYSDNYNGDGVEVIKLLTPHIIKDKKEYTKVLLEGLKNNCKKTIDFTYDKLNDNDLQEIANQYSLLKSNPSNAISYFLNKINSDKSKKHLINNIDKNNVNKSKIHKI